MENVTEILRLVPLNHYILLSGLLFSIGVIGVLFRRNAIVILMRGTDAQCRQPVAGGILQLPS